MNKLSELSNPAWIVGQQEIADFMRGDEALLVRGYDPESTEPALRMYSQEYVSALTQRIAELESANQSQDDHINQQQDRIESLEKTNTGLGQRLGAAEKRLATPVRLPEKDDLRLAGDASTKVVIKFRNSAIDECAKALRASGFTVEGDE
ncbi:TPA: hypothetical protein SLF59_000580 [Serratia marcescens]|nr:hypothetical protein [Serratia marcescens]